MSHPEPYPFEFIDPPPVDDPSTRERAVQATADLGSAAGSVVDVAAAGLHVPGEAVAAGCDLFGMVVEGALGLIGGLFS